MVIVADRPKPGMEDPLLELVRDRVPFLRRLKLVTDRPALAMRGSNHVIVEVFEWQDGAVALAHEHADVQKLRERFAAVCDYMPLRKLPEASGLFAEFEPIEL